MVSHALYIHWPFCLKKCPYCDFNSHVRDAVDHAAWEEALLHELGYWAECLGERTALHSIFFGGGTPSLMPPRTVARLLEAAQELFVCDPEIEITLEANPTSVEAGKFAELAAAGVNRLSLGVQSFDAVALQFLGRAHSAQEARTAIALAAKHFPRYSFDLIYALPQQTPAQWQAQLREALGLARGHLSLYQLTIEENTAFHHAYHHQHRFTLPDADAAADLYELTAQVCATAGLRAYEISNYATPGQESRHNLGYWRGEPYLGIGPGAHGRVDLAAGDRHATRTLASPERWLAATLAQGHGLESQARLTEQERLEERLMMGLRLGEEGLARAGLTPPMRRALDAVLQGPRAQRLVADGLLELTPQRLRATARGQLLLNQVVAELIS